MDYGGITMIRDLELAIIFRENEIKKEGIEEEIYAICVDEMGLVVNLNRLENGTWESEMLIKNIALTNFEEGIEWIQKICKMNYEEFKTFLV